METSSQWLVLPACEPTLEVLKSPMIQSWCSRHQEVACFGPQELLTLSSEWGTLHCRAVPVSPSAAMANQEPCGAVPDCKQCEYSVRGVSWAVLAEEEPAAPKNVGITSKDASVEGTAPGKEHCDVEQTQEETSEEPLLCYIGLWALPGRP